MTTTKADLIEAVYNSNSQLSKKQARETVETVLELMKSTLVNGEDVLLSGFGKLSVKKKNSRRGRNPQTGEQLQIEARKVITFKPSGKLRDRVNK